ncbi:MAG TPA: DUF433 domain-containing protein [Pirellulales bacterium]|jgi:uncharacterized protein (DUF433 family)|nr:DUF433 domain-containing protein [Pirellulales bacterium]
MTEKSMNAQISIVDRGRGPQLSTSRITVQDLVPYIQLGCTHQQILEVMPTLSDAEIQAVEDYVDGHREEVLEQDRRIRARNAARRNPPHVEEILRRARQERLARTAPLHNQSNESGNGEGHPG